MGACQANWLSILLSDLNLKTEGEMVLLVDNKSPINLAKNPIAHGRSKHIETRFHFLRDQVNKGKLRLEFCRNDDQMAYVFTKPVKKERFEELRFKLGVRSLESMN